MQACDELRNLEVRLFFCIGCATGVGDDVCMVECAWWLMSVHVLVGL